MGASSSTCSSSTLTDGGKYDLFVSFRGEDVRDNFISHLRDALSRKKIDFFVDEKLQRGDEIWPELSSAIEESRISLVIFSKDYASSKWCLRELVKILECKEKKKQIVMPVFYHVNPSDVRKQRGSFEDAFVNHENVSEEEKQKWRDALTKASNLCGLNSSVIGDESRLTDEIVKDVSNKLNGTSPSSNFEGLVGINSGLEKVKSLLDLETSDFRVVGIWGMGGIGKTTIIGAVFEQISSQFEGCFFANIRKESEKSGGLVHLQKEIICEILGDEIENSGTPNIHPFIKRRLQKKKVFIVLDDVDNSKQLEFLAGGLNQFGPGSRVIVITRDKQVFRNCDVKNIYEVKTLTYLDSLQLFCKWAFKQDYPPKDFKLLVDMVVNYASGNPLALKVLGSSLNGKSKQEWESALDKLQRSLNPEILDVLKISYDGLDHEDKDIFLDIACFFEGENADYVAEILGDCSAKIPGDCSYSLSVLISKSLVTISHNSIRMHDLLQEMGREIVRKESPNKLGNRSRWWKQEDALRALKNNDVTDAVQGIFLDMSELKDIYLNSLVFEKMKNLRFLQFYFSTHDFEYISEDIYLNSLVFEKMKNLKLLKFYFSTHDFEYISKVHISNALNYISDELRSFQWYGCPLKVLPSCFDPKKLVELVLPWSNVEQLWEGSKKAPKLRRLILNGSPQLTKIPDLSDIPLIEVIDLKNCKSLLNIHSSIRYLNNLWGLLPSGCKNLRSFPSNIHFEALECLNFSDCINLTKFPHISGNIRRLFFCRTGVEEVPSSIQNLNKLVLLDMSECKRLKCISTSISTVKSLKRLNLKSCSQLESFPEILEIMECWKILDLSGTAIKELPASIEHLNRLENLSLCDCKYLETLPSSLCNLSSLTELNLSHCWNLEKLPENLGYLKNLESLSCVECRGLTTLPPLSGLHSLRYLSLEDCSLAEIPKDIGSLSSLENLDLCGNLFESLPKSIKQLSRLKFLMLNDCNMLQSLTNLPSGLPFLDAMNCKQLCQFFPDTTEFVCCSEGYLQVALTNCLKLNCKAVINFFEELLLIMKEYQKPVIDFFSICMPGSEIPAWFRYQSSGSSVNIQILRDNWVARKCVGFALCAVLGFEEDYNDYDGLHVLYNYHFETSDVCSEKYDRTFFRIIGNGHGRRIDQKVSIHSHHILLGYVSFEFNAFSGRLEQLPARDRDNVDVSFEFETNILGSVREPGCKVKYCAVHPIYSEAESIGSVKIFGYAIQDIQETSRWRSGKSDDHDKKVEPHPKRICTEANRCSQSAIQTFDR